MPLDVLSIPSDEYPVLASAYEALKDNIDKLYVDPLFKKAYGALDTETFTGAFTAFAENMEEYNKFHRRERRLWATKIGKGRLAPTLEEKFRKSIPEGRKNYEAAFKAVDTMCDALVESGLDKVMEKHLPAIMGVLENEQHPFSQLTTRFFVRAGTTREMLDEFRIHFAPIHYNFFGAVGPSLVSIQAFSVKARKAQLSILDHTSEHGFDYLRGECGPPAWAILASKILASAGISVSAWILVAIIAALLAILAIICAAASDGSLE
ncbi:MAG: hypothetical protein NT002_00355 [candidate division Zixibacteria bacterium]|nr:hypothetical protein [candidate division Zixibacteria bacterium]